jgi:hypothetical protein
MASPSVPQQGTLPTEVIGQIGSLDSTQVAQILRNLPGLLNKVSSHFCADFLSLAMWLANAICELGPVAPIVGGGSESDVPIARVSCDRFWNVHPLRSSPHSDTTCQRRFSFPSWIRPC